MTPKSKRELKRAVENLDRESEASERDSLIVYAHPETGVWHADREMASQPLTPGDVDPVMVLEIPADDVHDDQEAGDA